VDAAVTSVNALEDLAHRYLAKRMIHQISTHPEHANALRRVLKTLETQ
jgi:hypothetical protein